MPLATRAYEPQPVRSLAAQWAATTALCVACLATGAAGGVWHAQHNTSSSEAAMEQPSTDEMRAMLAQARLALAQEAAARATLQEAAEASAAKIDQLHTDLRFLRDQRTRQP